MTSLSVFLCRSLFQDELLEVTHLSDVLNGRPEKFAKDGIPDLNDEDGDEIPRHAPAWCEGWAATTCPVRTVRIGDGALAVCPQIYIHFRRQWRTQGQPMRWYLDTKI